MGVVNDKNWGGVFVRATMAVCKAGRNGVKAWNGRDVFSLGQAPDGTIIAGTSHGLFRLDEGTSETWSQRREWARQALFPTRPPKLNSVQSRRCWSRPPVPIGRRPLYGANRDADAVASNAVLATAQSEVFHGAQAKAETPARRSTQTGHWLTKRHKS